MKKMKFAALVVSFAMIIGTGLGCSQNKDEGNLVELNDPVAAAVAYEDGELIDLSLAMVPLAAAPAMFNMPMPAATGSVVSKNDKVVVDYSNAKDGYVMIKYLKNTNKALRVIVKGPSTSYTYNLNSKGEYDVFPLSDGSGSYTVSVFENVSGNKFATSISANINAALTNEFAPFLRPNQYVNYTANSRAVALANDLTKNAKNMPDQITAIYNYVVTNISYDQQLAASVQSGYIPNLDAVLASKKGICFDYASLMTAMLRSQGVPTKLVIGYAGKVYHAWISTYSEETGWVENVIYFDGRNWNMMDPTFASTGGQSSQVMQYIGDGANYTAKHLF